MPIVSRTWNRFVRMETAAKVIYLVFTGHEFADGAETSSATFAKHSVKGSFFFTGDFYRNRKYASIIQRLKSDGHYLSTHSDKHLLYCMREDRNSLLATKDSFTVNLKNNCTEMEKFGLRMTDAPFFIPPYEWQTKKLPSG